MDVRAEKRGRPHPKSAFSCGPGGGEKLFDPWAFGRKGQECPREIRTKKFRFMLFFFPENSKYPVRLFLVLRLSFPATGPLDPGTDFQAPGSLTHRRFRHLLEGCSKGS